MSDWTSEEMSARLQKIRQLQKSNAILREALERIAKEQVTYYESTAPGTASLDSYTAKQRPTEAAAIAREAHLRAGMGEK